MEALNPEEESRAEVDPADRLAQVLSMLRRSIQISFIRQFSFYNRQDIKPSHEFAEFAMGVNCRSPTRHGSDYWAQIR
jgi:hypothetical protein